MQRKNKILLIVLGIAILALLCIWIFDNIKSSKRNEFRDFSIEDTASITKIFLVDKNNHSVVLERENNYWTVNKKYKARKDFIETLLETMKDMRVQSPVSESQMDYVLKNLSVEGIKVEIYQNNRKTPAKVYYVGNSDKKGTGTFMILEGSDVPFVLGIPGFSGYLTIRYIPEENEWKERIVFNYNIPEIKQVKIEYPENPENSFIIKRFDNGIYKLSDINGKDVNFECDTLALKEYYARIKFIGFDSFLESSLQQSKLDSLKQITPLNIYTVNDTNGNSRTLKTYHRPNFSQVMEDDGSFYEWDVDFLYGIIEEDNVVVLLQYYILDPIRISKEQFRNRASNQ